MENIQKKVRQHGIGLLELMLSLTIIAILLIAATRYYQSAQTSRQIQVAMESVQSVYAATQQYYNDYGTVPTLELLKKSAMLPNNFNDFANPWGGGISDDKTTGCIGFGLKFLTNVPKEACSNIKNKVTSNYPDSNITITCADSVGDMTVCYPSP